MRFRRSHTTRRPDLADSPRDPVPRSAQTLEGPRLVNLRPSAFTYGVAIFGATMIQARQATPDWLWVACIVLTAWCLTALWYYRRRDRRGRP